MHGNQSKLNKKSVKITINVLIAYFFFQKITFTLKIHCQNYVYLDKDKASVLLNTFTEVPSIKI